MDAGTEKDAPDSGAADSGDKYPWQDQFDIVETEMVAETPDLRVVRLTLGPGECVPWHWHTNISDHFVCVQGALEIETRAPRAMHRLRPGQEAVVPAKVAHIVRNASSGTSQFLVIQGVGDYDYQPVGG